MSVVLGVDISSSCIGIGCVENGKNIIHTEMLKPSKKKLPVHFYNTVYEKIGFLIREFDVDDVVIEDLNIRFLKSAKAIFPIHGVVKLASFREKGVEPSIYHVSTWRYTLLGLKDFTKDEIAEIKKTSKNDSEFKRLSNIKMKVIEYVNGVFDINLTYVENDIADALGLCLAHQVKLGF